MAPVDLSDATKNWLKAALGLKHLKNGLLPFVDNLTSAFHNFHITNYGACNQCTTENILKCTTRSVCRKNKYGICQYHDNGNPLRQSRPCVYGICDNIRDAISREHFKGEPMWKNTDASKWSSDAWEVAKCFLPPGSKGDASSADTDCTGILSLCLHWRPLRTQVGRATQDFEKNRDNRNKLMHSGRQELSNTDRSSFIQDAIRLLSTYETPVSQHTQDCIDTLIELDSGGLLLTTDDVLDVMEGKVDAIRKKQEELEAELQELLENTAENAVAIVDHQTKLDSYKNAIKELDDGLKSTNSIVQSLDVRDDVRKLQDEMENIRTQNGNIYTQINQRMEELETKVLSLEIQMMAIDKKHDRRHTAHDERLEDLDERLNKQEECLKEHDERHKQIEQRMDKQEEVSNQHQGYQWRTSSDTTIRAIEDMVATADKQTEEATDVYDAFVCYNPEGADLEFVKLLIEKLEEQEKLKLFVPWRDDLPGTSHHTLCAQLIVQRCRRVIIVLSPRFLTSASCDFQVKVAVHLSPGARNKTLIPILLEPCNIPDIICFVNVCDYTRTVLRDWFWNRLIMSLKCPVPSDIRREPTQSLSLVSLDTSNEISDWSKTSSTSLSSSSQCGSSDTNACSTSSSCIMGTSEQGHANSDSSASCPETADSHMENDSPETADSHLENDRKGHVKNDNNASNNSPQKGRISLLSRLGFGLRRLQKKSDSKATTDNKKEDPHRK